MHIHTHFLSIHLLMATYRFSFYALVIVNNAAVNTGMHASFRVSEVFFRYMYPGVGLPWHMLVHFLRIFHIIFHNGCHNLHSHSQCTKVSSSAHPHQDFLFFLSFFLTTLLLPGMRWYFIVLLVCISLISNAKNCLCSPIPTWFG